MYKSQADRLDFLVEAFKKDSGRYSDIPAPQDTAGKQRLLRSLMNVRTPRRMSQDVLRALLA